MKNSLRIVLVAVIGVALTASMLLASEVVGIFAVVDKVVFEPNEKSPQRIQVWGAFTSDRNTSRVQRGYMYFRLPAGFHPVANDAAKAEWADLKTVAGTGKAIAFGQRFFPCCDQKQAEEYFLSMPRVRPATEKPETPDAYPVNIGLTKVTDSTLVDRLRDAKN